ncbi:MAG: nitrile hydratase subunit beta [Alphaproteobacteria bacterium]|nr:nitrile hydratase subunit beta [Alphaproteobacteria bacterium]|tara:strand:+ start:1694 stop:2356 length:663 start_codon:yes stop_codon:yes gene_type:complete
MDSVHDLGGVEGFGPVPVEQDEPVFHHDWESRVLAMRVLMGFWGKWNIDANRHSLERLPPAEYLSLSYYEKWAAGLVNISVEKGLITRDEVAAGRPDPAAGKQTPPVDPKGLLSFMPKGRPSARDIEATAAFAVGDQVRTARNMHSGHTRLPRYMRDRVGEVVLRHGVHVLPDVSATLTADAPEHLYAVRFDARELWGDDADVNHTVTADLWESYLAPAG